MNTEFKKLYGNLIDEFCQKLISQYNKDEKVFLSNEPDLIELKLNQIRPEIERLDKSFTEKTKHGFDKVVRYGSDEIALYGYKKFEGILLSRSKELAGKKKTTVENFKTWVGSDQKRKDLIAALRLHNLIDAGSADLLFIGVTQWSGENTALYRLIEKLKGPYVKKALTINEILKYNFLDSKGNQFNPDSVNTSISKGQTPRSADTIDSIVNNL